MAQKRERSVNFTRDETNLLISLVGGKRHVLENKKSDAVTWSEKESCWKEIEACFNSTNYRSAKTLKLKYEGIKRDTRKKSASIRAETYATGGGPKTAPELTPIEEKVKSMILLSVDGMESTFDSDHVAGTSSDSLKETKYGTHLESGTSDNIIIEYGSSQREDDIVASEEERKEISAQPAQGHTILYGNQLTPKASTSCIYLDSEDGYDSGANKKWSQWKPKSLQSKKHPALCTPKPRRPFEKLAESKLEVAHLQRQLVDEELENKRKQWIFEERDREQQQKRWDFDEEERRRNREQQQKRWDFDEEERQRNREQQQKRWDFEEEKGNTRGKCGH